MKEEEYEVREETKKGENACNIMPVYIISQERNALILCFCCETTYQKEQTKKKGLKERERCLSKQRSYQSDDKTSQKVMPKDFVGLKQ